MATIRDVAKIAGVSPATVSIYLNNRKHLKNETVSKIESAIKELNYVVHTSGHELRAKNSNDIGIIFDNISEPYLEKVINGIKGYLTRHRKSFIFEFTDGDASRETRAILNFIGRKVAGIIIYSCQPNNVEIFSTLKASKIPYVLIDRKVASFDSNLVTIDNNSLFEKLTLDLLKAGHEHIALICGPKDYYENQSAYQGFLNAHKICGKSPHQNSLIFTSFQREDGFRACMKLLDAKVPSAILTTGFRLAEGVRYALSLHHFDTTKDIQLISTGDSMDDVFYNDPSILKTSRASYLIGEAVARLLLANMKSPVIFEPQEITFKDSYPSSYIQKPSIRKKEVLPSKDTINVLLLDDDISIHGLQQLFVDFYAKENIAINVQKVLPKDMFKKIVTDTLYDDTDVIMFDVPWLAYLAGKSYLYCIDDFIAKDNFNYHTFVPHALQRFGEFNSKQYALPYMACSQLLFYRRDLFENKDLQQQFYDKYMLPLEAPKTWVHYNAIAQFFTREYNSKSPVTYGHTMSIAYPEQLICELMPRIWAFGDNFCNSEGAIHFNTQKILRAIENMLKSVSYSDPQLFSNQPKDSIEQFQNGETAMLCTYYNYATSIVDQTRSKITKKYAYASIPGRCPVLAGWSLGISNTSKKPELAYKFIKWACGNEISIAHTILGGQSPHIAAYNNYDLHALYPWLSLALDEFKYCKERQTPRDSAGNVLNEKFAEEIIFSHISPLLQKSYSGQTINRNTIIETLIRIERDLTKKLH